MSELIEKVHSFLIHQLFRFHLEHLPVRAFCPNWGSKKILVRERANQPFGRSPHQCRSESVAELGVIDYTEY